MNKASRSNESLSKKKAKSSRKKKGKTVYSFVPIEDVYEYKLSRYRYKSLIDSIRRARQRRLEYIV